MNDTQKPQTGEEIQSSSSRDAKFKKQMGFLLVLAVVLAVMYYKGKADEKRTDKSKKVTADAQEKVAGADTTKPEEMPHGLMGGKVQTKAIQKADEDFVKMSEKSEEMKKADEARKGQPGPAPYSWDRPGGGQLPAGVAPDGSAGSAVAQGAGTARPPSYIPEGPGMVKDPAAKAAQERNMVYYDPRYYYKTPQGYVRPSYQTGSYNPTMDKLHEALEQNYFASFASPTTVGLSKEGEAAIRRMREVFGAVNGPLWPGQPPARPIKEAPPATGQPLLPKIK